MRRSLIVVLGFAAAIAVDRASAQSAIHLIVREDYGCDSLDRHKELTDAARARDLERWMNVLYSGHCTKLWPGDRVILEFGPVGGLIRIRNVGATVIPSPHEGDARGGFPK